MGHISALLTEFAAHRLGEKVLADEDRTARVVLARPTLGQLLDLAVTQPRRYGAGDPQLLARLYQLLGEVAWVSAVTDRPAVSSQLSRLEATTADQDFDEQIRQRLVERAAEVRVVLERDRPG